MLQIKTIYDKYSDDFDRRVNAALADGWTLTRRACDGSGFLAELEKEIITEAEETCDNCKHRDIHPEYEPCNNCLNGEKWEPES